MECSSCTKENGTDRSLTHLHATSSRSRPVGNVTSCCKNFFGFFNLYLRFSKTHNLVLVRLDGGSGVVVEVHSNHITQIGMECAINFKKFRLGPIDLHTGGSEIVEIEGQRIAVGHVALTSGSVSFPREEFREYLVVRNCRQKAERRR